MLSFITTLYLKPLVEAEPMFPHELCVHETVRVDVSDVTCADGAVIEGFAGWIARTATNVPDFVSEAMPPFLAWTLHVNVVRACVSVGRVAV